LRTEIREAIEVVEEDAVRGVEAPEAAGELRPLDRAPEAKLWPVYLGLGSSNTRGLNFLGGIIIYYVVIRARSENAV